jgi:hypothetical protein
MYVNAKMLPVEIVPVIMGGRMKQSSGGVNSSKNLCKCYSVPPPNSTMIKN